MEQLSLQQRSLIRATAFAVLRNGSQYFEWIKTKRRSDPLYAFLSDGVGSQYYDWCLSNPDGARKEESVESEASISLPNNSRNDHIKHSGRHSDASKMKSRSRSQSRSRSRSHRRHSPRRRTREFHRYRNHRSRSRDRNRSRVRSPALDDQRSEERRHGKMYAWSSEEEPQPKSSELIKQKLENMKQKLQVDSSVKLGA